MVRSRHCKSAEFLNVLNDQVIPSIRFSLPWWLGHIPGQQCQDSLGSSCERVEHEDTWVSGSMRSHFHTWIGHHRVLTLTPLKVFVVKGKDWRNGLTLLSSIQNLGQKLMQLWMEINVVTLHKVVETMPQQMHSVIKAKGESFAKGECATFFLDGECIFRYSPGQQPCTQMPILSSKCVILHATKPLGGRVQKKVDLKPTEEQVTGFQNIGMDSWLKRNILRL